MDTRILSLFPHYNQTESKDCGSTCIKIVAKHFGKIINSQQLRNLSETTPKFYKDDFDDEQPKFGFTFISKGTFVSKWI